MMKNSKNNKHPKTNVNGIGPIKKTCHYDRDGRKTRETWEQITQSGLKKIEYYDRDGRKTGESIETTGGFGFKRIEYFNRDGQKTGEVREKIL